MKRKDVDLIDPQDGDQSSFEGNISLDTQPAVKSVKVRAIGNVTILETNTQYVAGDVFEVPEEIALVWKEVGAVIDYDPADDPVIELPVEETING